MAQKGLGVEDQILELAPFDGHDHRPVGGVERRDHPLRAAIPGGSLLLCRPGHRGRSRGITRCRVSPSPAWGGAGRLPKRAHCLDGADLNALPAAGAPLLPDDGEEAGRVHGVEDRETAGGDQRLAAAAAAVADEIDPFPDVFPELDEPLVISPCQEIQPLGHVDGAGKAVTDQGVGGVVEGHADLHRRGAGPADVLHFVAAVADADRPVGGAADDLACPLVVEDVEGVFSGQARFMDENPSELRLPLGEEGLDERLLDVEILIIEFA